MNATDRPTGDPFELEVRAAFRRKLQTIEPLVRTVAVPAVESVGVPRETGSSLADRPASLAEVRRTSAALPLGLAAALAVVFLAALLAPAALRGPAATPSPAAQWTALRWSDAKTDGKTIPTDLIGGQSAAWHEGWVLADRSGASFSADGSSWDRTLDLPSTTVSDLVTAGPAGFVVAAAYKDGAADSAVQTAIYVSADGRTWRQAGTSGFDGQNQVWEVAAGPRGMVAVGQAGPAGQQPTGFGAWFSRDGLSWQRVPDDPTLFGNDPPYSVAALADGFVMSGTFRGAPMLWRSVDGLHWERCDVPAGSAWTGAGAIGVGSAGIVAIPRPVSDGPKPAGVWTSKDGQTWTSNAMADPPNWVSSDGARIVARWDDGAGVVSAQRRSVSFDGAHWSAVTDYPDSSWLGFSSDTVLTIRQNRVYAVPVSTETVTPEPSAAETALPSQGPTLSLPAPTPSRPAGAWTGLSWPSTSLGSLGMGPDLAAIGPKGIVARWRRPAVEPCGSAMVYSHGGNPFQNADMSDPSFRCAIVEAVVAIPTGFVGWGSRDADDPAKQQAAIWTSADGSVWAPVSTSAFAGATIRDMGYIDGELVAVGSNAAGSAVWASTDGSVWQTLPNDVLPGEALTKVSGNSRFGIVAVAPGGHAAGAQASATIWHSTGTTWIPRTDTANDQVGIRDVYVGRDGMLVCGVAFGAAGQVTDVGWHSADGDTWTPSDACAGSLLADGTRIVRLDGSRTIEESFDGVNWSNVDFENRDFALEALGPDGVLIKDLDSDELLWYLTATV